MERDERWGERKVHQNNTRETELGVVGGIRERGERQAQINTRETGARVAGGIRELSLIHI